MKPNILKEKSFQFAIRIIKLNNFLKAEHREFELSRQLVRSGTAIGALIREAEHAESKKDFIHKLNVALKEANETQYWLELFFATQLLAKTMFDSLKKDCDELLKMLVSSIKTCRLRLK